MTSAMASSFFVVISWLLLLLVVRNCAGYSNWKRTTLRGSIQHQLRALELASSEVDTSKTKQVVLLSPPGIELNIFEDLALTGNFPVRYVSSEMELTVEQPPLEKRILICDETILKAPVSTITDVRTIFRISMPF